MERLPNRRFMWLLLVSATPRILGAFLLPNAFGDAYVYIRDIGTLSTKLSTGTFHLTDLFGFWLPLYQLVAAVLNLVVNNGFYSGKLVAALFGVGACLLVYGITRQLTGNRKAASVIFLLIALNPLHIFYSASAMTDLPHAFLVLAALYFLLTRNCIVAAIFGALAGFTRVESWMLIALIPFVQFIRERRISFLPLLILAIPPLFWFYISWKATGNWLACFVQRQEYHEWLLQMNPSLARFSLMSVLRDVATLLISTDIAVLSACFVAAWLIVRRAPRPLTRKPIKAFAASRPAVKQTSTREFKPAEFHAIAPPVIFFFAFLGLLLIAYLTHQQPIIFPRYGLILFSLGLPILAWTFLRLKEERPPWAQRILIGAVIILSLDAGIQLVGAIGTLNQISVQRRVADYLRDHFDKNSNAKIFSDDGTVQVMSGIRADRFVSSMDGPRDREAFLNLVREKNIEYIVFIKKEDSIPGRLFPDAAFQEPEGFEVVMHSYTKFLPTDIWLFRVRSLER